LKLSLSIAARDRLFAKTMRRLLPEFDRLKVDVSTIEMVNPIHEAMLIGMSDEQPAGSFEVVSNHDGFFQVLAGVEWPATGEQLKTSMEAIICEAIYRCPFSQPDRSQFSELLARHGLKGTR
jgi:hypothetical protein